MGYSFRLTARVLLYAPSHRQNNTYHGLCYTSRGALAGTRNSSMGPLHEGSIRRPITPWANALTTELHLAPGWGMRMVLDDYLRLNDRTEHNFIYTQAVIYGIWGYLQWAFHIIIFDQLVLAVSHSKLLKSHLAFKYTCFNIILIVKYCSPIIMNLFN